MLLGTGNCVQQLCSIGSTGLISCWEYLVTFSVPAFAVRQVFWLWFSSTLLEVLDCWASSSSPWRLAGSTTCPCRPGSLAMNFDWCHWISIVGNFDWTLEVHPKEFDWWFMKFAGGAKKRGWLPSCVCFWEIDSKFDFIIWFSIGSFGQSFNLRAKQETVEHCQKHSRALPEALRNGN